MIYSSYEKTNTIQILRLIVNAFCMKRMFALNNSALISILNIFQANGHTQYPAFLHGCRYWNTRRAWARPYSLIVFGDQRRLEYKWILGAAWILISTGMIHHGSKGNNNHVNLLNSIMVIYCVHLLIVDKLNAFTWY